MSDYKVEEGEGKKGITLHKKINDHIIFSLFFLYSSDNEPFHIL